MNPFNTYRNLISKELRFVKLFVKVGYNIAPKHLHRIAYETAIKLKDTLRYEVWCNHLTDMIWCKRHINTL